MGRLMSIQLTVAPTDAAGAGVGAGTMRIATPRAAPVATTRAAILPADHAVVRRAARAQPELCRRRFPGEARGKRVETRHDPAPHPEDADVLSGRVR